MRRLVTFVVALMVAAGGVLGAQKVTTVDELDRTMKRVGPAQQAAGKAIASMQYADARKQLDIVRQALMDAENFWVINKRDDAIKINKEVLANLVKLDQMLAGSAVDSQAALAALKGAGCGACHKQYRVQEGENYMLRPGSI